MCVCGHARSSTAAGRFMIPLLCPFCESTALSIGYSFSLAGKKRYVSCRCGAQEPEKRTTSEAISAWNSRMKVWFYDSETLTCAGERRRTAAYIDILKRDGFTPELIAAPQQEVK
ncbi:Lar family restriction alleviation protein [Enterobacter ludwigii]|uniref:Lar family restriction alleviation protein n=2 Tax=Enterobacter TaxID=547 RepID=UPI002AC82813|nr:Lar family restriction alleviation protein [Enterobacter ludwigii]